MPSLYVEFIYPQHREPRKTRAVYRYKEEDQLVNRAVVVAQKLMEAGEELKNASKHVLYKTSTCMEARQFVKY